MKKYMPPEGRIPALSDLEEFELMVAAFPERYAEREDAGEDIWDEVMSHYSDIVMEDGDDNPMKDLLARLMYLAPILESPLSKDRAHALGKPTEGGHFQAAVTRPAFEEGS